MEIKIDTSKPEDIINLRQYFAFIDKSEIIEELYNKARSQLKHGDFKTIKEATDFVEEVRMVLYDIVYGGE